MSGMKEDQAALIREPRITFCPPPPKTMHSFLKFRKETSSCPIHPFLKVNCFPN